MKSVKTMKICNRLIFNRLTQHYLCIWIKSKFDSSWYTLMSTRFILISRTSKYSNLYQCSLKCIQSEIGFILSSYERKSLGWPHLTFEINITIYRLPNIDLSYIFVLHNLIINFDPEIGETNNFNRVNRPHTQK